MSKIICWEGIKGRITACLLSAALLAGAILIPPAVPALAKGATGPAAFSSGELVFARTSAARTSAARTSAASHAAAGIPAFKIRGVMMVRALDLARIPGLDMEVKYRSGKKLLEIDRNNLHGQIGIGKKKMTVNNEIHYKLPAAVCLVRQKNGKKVPMVPARKIATIFRLSCRYHAGARTVSFTAKKAKVGSMKNIQTRTFMYMSTKEFVNFLGPVVQKDYRKHGGILPSVTIAQAIHESFSGCSLLAQKGNNIFGMKAYLSGNNWSGSAWKGKSFTKRTSEQYGNRVVHISDRFRRYDNVNQNIRDHRAYFSNAKDGSHKRYAGIGKTKDYKKQLKLIRKGGYCTFSDYTRNLERLIKEYNLTRFDQ